MSMVFALVLLGCADDGSACERLTVPAQIFETKAQCRSRQESALESDAAMQADYPTVVSRCLAHTPIAAVSRARMAARAR